LFFWVNNFSLLVWSPCFSAVAQKPPPTLLYFPPGGGGGGGGGEPERRSEGQQFTKLGQEYQHDCLYLQCINSDKHLQQSPS
jgi:hypothetical protein